MKINQILTESSGATVAFAFGRFNPAHQGHIEVWRTVEQAGANWFIGTNSTTLGPNDPLTFQQKSAWMTEIYPAISGHIVAEQSVLTLASYIFKKTRKNESATVAYITDAADWAWSGKLLNQYNGVEGAHGYYKFAEIIHVPSPRVSSATALRDAARADDRVAFYHASGTDPKSKVAGLTYFDTVKQAVEKYPLPVKKAKKVKEGWADSIASMLNGKSDLEKINDRRKKLGYEPLLSTPKKITITPAYKEGFKAGTIGFERKENPYYGYQEVTYDLLGVVKQKETDWDRGWLASKQGVAEQGYGNHPSQRVDPRTGKKYVPPKSPLRQGVAEGSLNEFTQGNGGDDGNDLQLYLNVAKKLNMKKYKPSTAHNLIAKKMAELVDVVDDDKVDYARHMARKEQGLPNMLEQGVAEDQLNELAGYGSEKGYTKLDSYKRYDVYVSKQKFNNLYYIAVAENPRTLTAKFKAKGKNPQEAIQNLYAEVDKEINVATKVSGRAIIDFNVDFVRDILELSTDTFYAKIISGPKLVLAGPDMMEYPEIMSSEGYKPSAIRTYRGGEGTTKLPAVPLSTSAAVTANLIANGRYVLGNEEIDKDGNRVFNLEFDSVVQDKNEKMRLRAPALTIGTARVSEETELVESTSLETTLKAIINDISEPVTSTYENLKYLAKKYVRDHGELDRGWNMVAMGPGSKWVEQFYKDKLKNELYDLIRYNSRYTVELQKFLRGVEINGELDIKRSFSNISRELPPILVTLGDKLQSPQLAKSAQRWMQNLKDYHAYLASSEIDDDDEDDYTPAVATPRSAIPGQQNAQVEKIVNDILAKLPRNVSGEIRNIIARSPNKLQALQQELTDRNLSVKESSEQKTVTKTWDQMTPQEKISGVRGRTVWNEKTQRYYTVFDVPANEVDEASLATMRDYFAGDEKAQDPMDITQQRLHFAKDKNARPTVDKRFRSPAEYQAWLKQNKLRQISGVNESTNDKGWTLTNKKQQ